LTVGDSAASIPGAIGTRRISDLMLSVSGDRAGPGTRDAMLPTQANRPVLTWN